MASVKQRPGGQWRARYRDEAGREHARHFAKKVDAQKWLDQVTASIVRGDYVDPAHGRVLVSEYAETWQQIQVSSPGTQRIVDNALRLHVIPALGGQRMSAVRPSAVQGFVRELEGKGLAPGSVRNIFDVLAQMFASAADDRLIAHSPCRKIKLPKANDDELEIPTVEQVAAVADAIGGRWRALVVLLAGSGLRIGEARGLQVDDVDWLRREIRVRRQRGQDGVIGPVKSKSSRRTVPVGQVVIDELAAHLASYPSEADLFVDEIGEPLPYWRWKRLLKSATADAGVELTAHGLRHFTASALIAGGASVKQVQMMLGHASAVVTLRTYAHLWPGDEDRTRNVLDAALGPLADSLRTEAASNE